MGGTYAKFNVGGEVREIFTEFLGECGSTLSVRREADVGWGNNALLTPHSTDDLCGELSASVGHRQGSRASAILSLDDFITTELNSVDESIVRGLVDARGKGVGGLGEERNDLHGNC